LTFKVKILSAMIIKTDTSLMDDGSREKQAKPWQGWIEKPSG